MDSLIINLADDENELNSKEKSSFLAKNKRKIITIMIILGILLFLIIIVIILLFLLKKDINKNYKYLGIINCIYKIENNIYNVRLLGNEFVNDFKLDIMIEGKKINFSKIYNFSSVGEHLVQFGLSDKNISFDYIFKDSYNLISVELISENNISINSMIGSFENCENLKKFENKGFKTEQVNSMKKLFFNTRISEFNFTQMNINTNNVKDISYIFSNIKSENISIYNFNVNKVLNMSHMFENCNLMTNLNIVDFNTNNANDISFMFNSCYSLKQLNLNNFQTSQITNMSFLFQDCINLSELNISNFNTNKVEDFSGMFNIKKEIIY